MTILYPKSTSVGNEVIAPAPAGADGINDLTSGTQRATVNGTLGNDTVAGQLPGQSIGLTAGNSYHTRITTP